MRNAGREVHECPGLNFHKLVFNFDEAAANSTDVIDVKFKSIPGITRAFNKTEESELVRGLRYPTLYGTAFAFRATQKMHGVHQAIVDAQCHKDPVNIGFQCGEHTVQIAP